MNSGKFRILVVDDDKDILQLIHMTLTPEYEVLTLDQSLDAAEIAEFFEPDIAILDIMMPKVTGYQLLETIKADPKLGHVLAIFLSAKDTNYDIKYGYKLGANLYLTKPFQPERLVKNIQMLLAQNGVTRPVKKTLSLRDVALRMKLKIGHFTPPEADDDLSKAADANEAMAAARQKRQHNAPETDPGESKKWVG